MKIIHQAAGAIPLRLRDFSFLLPVRRKTPTLLLPLIDVPVRRQATALPHPGIVASKLLSMSHSSFAKRASGLSSIEGGMGAETSSDCSSKLKVVGESTFLCSTDKDKVGLVQSPRSSGMICTTGAMTVAMASPSAVDETEDKVDNDM
jgi:hypothetical protein